MENRIITSIEAQKILGISRVEYQFCYRKVE